MSVLLFFKKLLIPLVATVLLASVVPPAAPAQHSLHIHILSGSNEYRSEASLTSYQQYLEEHHEVTVTASWVEDRAEDLPGIEQVPEADLLLVFCRRLQLPDKQIGIIVDHWEQGQPIVAVRTASHAFDDQTNQVFDHKVLGGDYQGHFDDRPVEVTNLEPGHPVLEGVQPFLSRKLYKAGELANEAVVLQSGRVQGEVPQPVTWVHRYNGGRMFYTSLGVPSDFENPNFRRMLTNAIFWAAESTDQ
ncbi:MAG: ThuA domain-containing protein [Balneolaceae bacterium]|nr:ThuA domain-containing protein [Balneolaceae bacterium]